MTTSSPHPAITDPTGATMTRRPAFTLVEILVVITIIGILMGIAIPAITNAVTRAKQTSQRLEINSLDQAIEAYALKYGDYPPDGSNEAVLNRHMRKIFPRMIEPDITLMAKLVDDEVDNTLGSFSGVAMDRGEALVFFLGGFSSDPQHPLTGSGGPISLVPGGTATDITNYQYNATRDNSFFDFDPRRLTMARVSETSPLISNDESLLGVVDAMHGGNDILPAYRAVDGEAAPIVYFDSRTYGVIGTDGSGNNIYNGYYAASVGGVRPYKTSNAMEPPAGSTYGSEAAAFNAIKFQRPNTFQIISPGSDGLFGSVVSTTPGSPGAIPTVHLVAETGTAVIPLETAAAPSGLIFTGTASNPISNGFQDRDWGSFSVNANLDNSTNFSDSTLGNGLELSK